MAKDKRVGGLTFVTMHTVYRVNCEQREFDVFDGPFGVTVRVHGGLKIGEYPTLVEAAAAIKRDVATDADDPPEHAQLFGAGRRGINRL
jgi:hypothetical protein